MARFLQRPLDGSCVVIVLGRQNYDLHRIASTSGVTLVGKNGGAASTPPWFESATAFADGLISVEQLLLFVHKARCQRVICLKSPGDDFHFLFRELTRADTAEY